MPSTSARFAWRFAALCLFAGVAAGIVAGLTLQAAAQPAGQSSDTPEYLPATAGVRRLVRDAGPNIKLLVDRSSLGGTEVEIGEITFDADYQPSPPHKHGKVEIFYVISGRLGHTVNGEKHVIEPGMVGIVRPGDSVVHSVESDEPVKGLVIWAPGGEADVLVNLGVFKSTPIEP
jgi:quercetin dioxygenase-like cupin family protein